MNILVTGGAGYIGSHTCVQLLEAGHQVTVVDDLSNASSESLNRVRDITGKDLVFHEADIADTEAMDQVFSSTNFDAVIHFAAFKAVGESWEKPLAYYRNNLSGTISLYEMMQRHGVKNIVFSSSATVYGDPESVPITEGAPVSATNPYGRTKLMMEQILSDVQTADPEWNVVILRYFNPVGAHPSGKIGEDPEGPPNNLMPFITQVAVGRREKLRVFGNDYPTVDGTGVRDYIHVVDLAKGHLKALEKIQEKPGRFVCNLGTGKGYSVLEVVKAFEAASGKDIPVEITDRRPGDIASCFAETSLAERALGWKAEFGIEQMCADSWRWQSANPNGYRTG